MITNISLYFDNNKTNERYHIDTEKLPIFRLKRILKTLNTISNLHEVINQSAQSFKDVAKKEFTPSAEQTWVFHHKKPLVEIQKTNYNVENDYYSRGQLLDEIEL